MGVKTAQVITYPQKNHPGQSCSHWAARIPAQAAQTYPCCKPLICQHKNLLSTAQAKPYYYYYLNIEVLVEQLNPNFPSRAAPATWIGTVGQQRKRGMRRRQKTPAKKCQHWPAKWRGKKPVAQKTVWVPTPALLSVVNTLFLIAASALKTWLTGCFAIKTARRGAPA